MELEEKNKLINLYKEQTIPELIKEMVSVKDELEIAKAAKTKLEEIHDILRLLVLPEKMDDEDVSTLTVPGVGRASIQSDIYFSIPADQRESCYEWLRENGHGDIIQETVNSSTGKSWAKEMMKLGKPIPEGMFKVTPFSRVQVTRIK